MMRREDDTNSYTPPNARIYEQDGDDFRVAPLPVLGASYLLGEQLKDLLDLSDTVTETACCCNCFFFLLLHLFVVVFPLSFSQGEVIVALSVDTIVTFWETYNVLAYTSDHQNTDSIIVVSFLLTTIMLTSSPLPPFPFTPFPPPPLYLGPFPCHLHLILSP